MSDQAAKIKCDHKFIDSKQCLKCGWSPDETQTVVRGSDSGSAEAIIRRAIEMQKTIEHGLDNEISREARVVVARCRWCDRNDRPIGDMAIFSYKLAYGGFTGVCKECMNDEKAEARYLLRMDARHNDPSSGTA